MGELHESIKIKVRKTIKISLAISFHAFSIYMELVTKIMTSPFDYALYTFIADCLWNWSWSSVIIVLNYFSQEGKNT